LKDNNIEKEYDLEKLEIEGDILEEITKLEEEEFIEDFKKSLKSFDIDSIEIDSILKDIEDCSTIECLVSIILGKYRNIKCLLSYLEKRYKKLDILYRYFKIFLKEYENKIGIKKNKSNIDFK